MDKLSTISPKSELFHLVATMPDSSLAGMHQMIPGMPQTLRCQPIQSGQISH